MIEKEIGAKIYTQRKALGLTLQEVADRVHVARSTIQRYEAGTIKNMKMPMLYSIAIALDLNPDWLIGKSDMKHLPSPETLNQMVFEPDGVIQKRVHTEITDSEYPLILAYRNAPPVIRQGIDAILSPYVPSLDDDKVVVPW